MVRVGPDEPVAGERRGARLELRLLLAVVERNVAGLDEDLLGRRLAPAAGVRARVVPRESVHLPTLCTSPQVLTLCHTENVRESSRYSEATERKWCSTSALGIYLGALHSAFS